jgi:hypothetical protein
VLHHGRHGREHHIGGGGSHNDEVDVARNQACCIQCFAGSFDSQVTAALIISSKVAGTDACALDDPVVGGFHPLLRQLGGQIGVGQAFFGQIAACANDA